MVGLANANQLVDNNYSRNIIFLDKERQLGLHSSGRNSESYMLVLLSTKSLKVKVCVEGAIRLKEWILKGI